MECLGRLKGSHSSLCVRDVRKYVDDERVKTLCVPLARDQDDKSHSTLWQIEMKDLINGLGRSPSLATMGKVESSHDLAVRK